MFFYLSVAHKILYQSHIFQELRFAYVTFWVLWFWVVLDGFDSSSQFPQLVLNSNVEGAFEDSDQSH